MIEIILGIDGEHLIASDTLMRNPTQKVDIDEMR